MDDSPSNVVLNFDIKFEALSFFDPKNKNIDHIAKYADFYYCRTNDNLNDDSTLKNYNYIKISDSISNHAISDETATLNYSFMISKQNYKYLIVKYILQKTAESAQAKVSKKDLGKIETKTSTSTTSITTRVATSVLPVWAFALIIVVGVILIVVSIIICCCCCACCAGCCRRRKTVEDMLIPNPLWFNY